MLLLSLRDKFFVRLKKKFGVRPRPRPKRAIDVSSASSARVGRGGGWGAEENCCDEELKGLRFDKLTILLFHR